METLVARQQQATPIVLPDGVLPEGLSLDGTIGAFQIGVLFAIGLFGLFCIQIYYYFEVYERDEKLVRWLIRLVWLLELTDVTSLLTFLYQTTVGSLGNYTFFFAKFPVSLDLGLLAGSLNNLIVEAFFAYRIRHLYGTWWITLLSWTLGASRLVLNSVLTSFAAGTTFAQFPSQFRSLIIATLTAAASQDVFTAAALFYKLGGAHFREGRFSPGRFLLLLAEAGMLQSILGVIELILLLSEPKSVSWLALHIITAEVYANSLMVSMNARRSQKNPFTGGNAATDYKTEFRRAGEAPKVNNIQISMTTKVETAVGRSERSDVDIETDSITGEERRVVRQQTLYEALAESRIDRKKDIEAFGLY